MEKVVSIEKLKTDLELEVLIGQENLTREIVLAEIHRPSVELTGYLIANNLWILPSEKFQLVWKSSNTTGLIVYLILLTL